MEKGEGLTTILVRRKILLVVIGLLLIGPHHHDNSGCFHRFVFNDPPTTEMYTAQYTLSLHDALPISRRKFPNSMGVPSSRSSGSPPGSSSSRIQDRKSTRLNSSHIEPSRMPSSA